MLDSMKKRSTHATSDAKKEAGEGENETDGHRRKGEGRWIKKASRWPTKTEGFKWRHEMTFKTKMKFDTTLLVVRKGRSE